MSFLADTMPVTCEDCSAPADRLSRFGGTSPVCLACEAVREREYVAWRAAQEVVE